MKSHINTLQTAIKELGKDIECLKGEIKELKAWKRNVEPIIYELNIERE